MVAAMVEDVMTLPWSSDRLDLEGRLTPAGNCRTSSNRFILFTLI
jgi:hypothetical protein